MAGRFGQWGGNGLQSQQGNYGGYTPPTSGANLALNNPGVNPGGGPAGTGDTGTGVMPSSGSGGSSSYGGAAPSLPALNNPGVGAPSGGGQQGFDSYPGIAPWMDDGGMVPTDDESNNSATIDPMQALISGRQKMGLPAQFYPVGDVVKPDAFAGPKGAIAQDSNKETVPQLTPQNLDPTNLLPFPPQPGTQSYFDGGVVPDQPDIPQNATPGTGAALPDPRQAMSYLAGAGGVSPDIANALEKANDPTGQLSPAERTLATVQNAGSPEAAFQVMQHYRTKFNAYSGAARAALDKGDLGQAAAHATAAMANVPTGYKVDFAPARGGLAMMSQKIGQKKQQGAADGGPIEDADPSTNVEDRRGMVDANGNGVPGGSEPTPKVQGIGGMMAGAPIGQGPKPASLTLDEMKARTSPLAGKLRQAGYDDGGGVIPTDVSAAGDDAGSASDEDTPPVADMSGASAALSGAVNTLGTPPEAAPTIMPPEHVKNILAKGFDYAMEKLGNVTDWLNGAFPDRLAQADQAMTLEGAQPATGAPPQGNASTTTPDIQAASDAAGGAAQQPPGGASFKGVPAAPGFIRGPSTDVGRQMWGPVGKFVAGQANTALGGIPGAIANMLTGTAAEGKPDVAAAINADQPQGQGKDQSQAPTGGKSDQMQTNKGGVDPQTAMRQATQMVDQAQPDLQFASRSKQRGALILDIAQKLISGQQQLAYATVLGGNKVGLEQMKETAAAGRTLSINQRSIEVANIRAQGMLQNGKDRDAVTFWGKVGAAMPGSTPDQITTAAQAQGLKMGFTPLQMKTAQRIYEQGAQQPDQVNGGQNSQQNSQLPQGISVQGGKYMTVVNGRPVEARTNGTGQWFVQGQGGQPVPYQP